MIGVKTMYHSVYIVLILFYDLSFLDCLAEEKPPVALGGNALVQSLMTLIPPSYPCQRARGKLLVPREYCIISMDV